jgi:hypothetical protein
MNYGIWMTSTEKVGGGFEQNSTGTDKFISSTYAYNDTAWHFAALSYDATTLKLYVDGYQVASLTTSALPETASTNPITVGRNSRLNDSNGCYFTGDVDDVKIYNRALTQQEIRDLGTGTDVAPSDRVAYLPF